MTSTQKKHLKKRITEILSREEEIQKIVLFGSFLTSDNPQDIDVAIFQNSNEKYLPLALKYRKLMREISGILPLDIIPLKINSQGSFINEIDAGEIIYER